MTIGFPRRRARRFERVAAGTPGLALLWLALAATTACSGGAEHKSPDAAPAMDAGRDLASTNDTPVSGDRGEVGVTLKPNGEFCTVPADCASNFCADGVCCNSACTDACYTCAAAGVVGTCLPADVGMNPRGSCVDEGAASCGNTGQCDGAGACQKYSKGTKCQESGCAGSTLTSEGRCDGLGACAGGTSQTCAPFVCATGATVACRTTCMTDADCIAPNSCIGGSCGKKPVGATCGNDAECNSTVCAQGVCCSAACTGTCKSCALTGSAGTCANVPAGQDPFMQCTDSGAATCGLDGTCDGAGACRKYASGTICGTDSCMAGTGIVAGRCTTTSTCGAGTMVPCSPYVCGGSSCLTKCSTSADCAAGYVCNGTICGKKPNGATCTAGSECTSAQCYQNVCCNVACSGTCMSCGLTGTVGTCTAIPAGTAPSPATQCTAAAASTCGNDGTCNGAGACRQFSAGTTCATPTCTGSTLTAARTCDGQGLCRAATTSMCDPFVCGSANACRIDCAASTDCVTPNICMNSSCGKLPPGAVCTTAAQCNSNFCAQGVCCTTACTGTCKSCALAGSQGTCANVPSGQVPAPATQCVDAGMTSCGNDGTCDGNGACRKYVSSTVCAGGTCTGSTYTPPRTCNGTGTCAAATSSSCNTYLCDTTMNICKTTCTVDGDCAPSYFCIGSACSKKPIGAVCTGATDCNSGFCAQGVCCASACTGTCQSCGLTASKGTCSPIPAGQAPAVATQCADAGAATCGTNGLCNGGGGCQLYGNGTTCVAGSCTGSTLTPPRTCDGLGVCKTVTTSLCDPYGCDTVNKVCKTTCTVTADCASPNMCTNMTCGSKPLGSTCASGSECNSGICAQSTCCSTTCAGTCVTCANTAGSCSAAAAGSDPLNQCTMAAATTCGLDGFCDGGGACRKYASGTQCAAATCTGSTLTSAATCNGGGTCSTPTTSSCSPYVCGTGACKTTCASNADCLGPLFVCTGTACTPATNLTLQLKEINIGSTQQITPNFRIINNGTSAVPLSELTVRYWYTIDVAAPTQSPNCDYTLLPGNCPALVYSAASFVAVSPARTGADYYFQFGFTAAAGSLAANGGGATGDIQVRWNKTTFTNYDQTNDYSYNAATAYTATTKVTVYRNGTLIYGTEP